MTKVAVLDDWQGVARTSADWSALQARAEVVFFAQAFENEADAVRQLADFDIVLSMRERTPLPGSLIDRLPKLRMLGMTGARNASLDTAACTARGIVVCNAVGGGYAEAATAELALGLLIAAARGIPAGDANIRAGKFQEGVPVGIGLAGKTLGVIGLGRLGSHMARYGKALNMNLLAWSQNLTAEKAQAAGATLVSKEELVSQSDAVEHPPGAVGPHARPARRGGHRADEAGGDPGEHLARADRGRSGADRGSAGAAHRGGAGCVRPRAAAGEPSAARRGECGDDAASGIWRAGDVAGLLSAERGERVGIPGRQAGAGHQSGSPGEGTLGRRAEQSPVPPDRLVQAVGDARELGVLGVDQHVEFHARDDAGHQQQERAARGLPGFTVGL